MVKLEELLGWMVKYDVNKMTLKIYHPDLISKMIKVLNNDVESLMNFITQINYTRGV